MKILLATNNQNKINEIKSTMTKIDVEETGDSSTSKDTLCVQKVPETHVEMMSIMAT